jgi:ribosomal-protein-alanine N-acetyltransferase
MRAHATIEAMSAADIGDVLAIETASFEEGSRQGRLDDAKLKEELARPWARLWLARRNKQTLAFILVWHVADELHVLDIATQPEARRTGLARRLMDYALEYARTNAIRHMLLEVRRSNVAAIRLYRACGFFAMGLRPKYYADDEDAVEMALMLDASGEVVRRADEVRIGV